MDGKDFPIWGILAHTQMAFFSSNSYVSRELLASLWLLWARFSRDSSFPIEFICRLQAQRLVNLGPLHVSPFGKWNLYSKFNFETFHLVKFLHEHTWGELQIKQSHHLPNLNAKCLLQKHKKMERTMKNITSILFLGCSRNNIYSKKHTDIKYIIYLLCQFVNRCF